MNLSGNTTLFRKIRLRVRVRDTVRVMTMVSVREFSIITSAEAGYVFGSVCLFVCMIVRRITEKVVNGF